MKYELPSDWQDLVICTCQSLGQVWIGWGYLAPDGWHVFGRKHKLSTQRSIRFSVHDGRCTLTVRIPIFPSKIYDVNRDNLANY